MLRALLALAACASAGAVEVFQVVIPCTVGCPEPQTANPDLKHPDARGVMERLVKWADVLTENFRAGVMDRLGFGYEVVKEWNPQLIYASNSGFGPEGEWAPRPSYDGMAQAFSGVLLSNGGGPSHLP